MNVAPGTRFAVVVITVKLLDPAALAVALIVAAAVAGATPEHAYKLALMFTSSIGRLFVRSSSPLVGDTFASPTYAGKAPSLKILTVAEAFGVGVKIHVGTGSKLTC